MSRTKNWSNGELIDVNNSLRHAAARSKYTPTFSGKNQASNVLYLFSLDSQASLWIKPNAKQPNMSRNNSASCILQRTSAVHLPVVHPRWVAVQKLPQKIHVPTGGIPRAGTWFTSISSPLLQCFELNLLSGDPLACLERKTGVTVS